MSERDLEILGLVPARGGSKGIPGKNLAVLGGKTLVTRAVQSGLESRFVNRVILSTDSEAIAAEGKRAGAGVPFMRPAELAADSAPTAPAVRHALTWLEENEGYRPDILVLLQPTAPLRQARHVDEAVALLVESGARSVVSVTPVPGHHHPRGILHRNGALVPFLETERSRREGRTFSLPIPGTGPSMRPGLKPGSPGRLPTAPAACPTS